MSRLHAKSAVVLLDEFDFSGVTNAVEISVDNGLADVTAFLDSDATFVEGKARFGIGVNGLWSPSSPAYDSEIFTDLTSEDRRLGVYPNGMTAGQRGYEAQTDVGGAPVVAPMGGVVALNVEFRGDTPLVRSWVLHRNAALAGSVNGTAYQAGAASAAQTIVGIIRLLGIGGAGSNTLDVRIESDDNEAFTSPTTRLTFTQLNQGSGATFEVKTAAGAVADAWWRVVATYAGGGTRTFDVVVTFGIRPT